MTISQNDILTAAAFLAIGWDERMKKEPGQGEAVKERYGMGMDGLISKVVPYAEVVESVWHDATDEERDSFCAVWAYEVLEPVGAWIAKRMIASLDIDADGVRAYALELFAEHTGAFNDEDEDETRSDASIADGLDDVALGRRWDGEALQLAHDHAKLSFYDKFVIRRYQHGIATATDHLELQALAIKIRS